MRATALLLGALLMAGEADGDDKKDPPKKPKPPFTEFVKIRPWSAGDNRFNDAHENVPLYWRKTDKGDQIKDKDGNPAAGVGFGAPYPTGPKSEITAADGKVYVVVSRLEGKGDGGAQIVYVKERDAKAGKNP